MPTQSSMLFHLSRMDVRMVNATAAGCCSICFNQAQCSSWSYSGNTWTPETPCHLSPYAFVSNETAPHEYCGGSKPDAPPAPAPPPPTPAPRAGPGMFVIDASQRHQVFEGIQVIESTTIHQLLTANRRAGRADGGLDWVQQRRYARGRKVGP